MTDQAEEIEIREVPVRVVNPVEPTRIVASAMYSRTIEEDAEKILKRDPRRSRCVIFSVDRPVYVGTSQEEVDSGRAFLLNNNIMLEITHTDDLWVGIAQVAQTGIVSVLVELGEL